MIGRRTFGVVATVVLLAACGEVEQGSVEVPVDSADAERRAYKDTVAAILADERAAFEAFFGPEADVWATLEGIAASEQRTIDFHRVLSDAQARAAELEAPALGTLFHGTFLEHFDRFVGDAAVIRDAIRAGQAEKALGTYERLRRGAFERLDFLSDRLALIDG
ncbi:MAG: hypothetical protein OXG64_08190 [Chloroflexi bacterium]|nr:hypothetical protein [Chloroflexota bacterium]MCY3959899.1 hypothetical protein [Chloroflexota bacterium]